MEHISVDSYVSGKLREGMDPEMIKRHLLMVGWSESQVREVLTEALVASGVPSPVGASLKGGNSKLVSAVEVVVNLFAFILLGVVATAFAILYYQIINFFYPDPLVVTYGSYDASRSAMHYAMSALLIGFPAYFFVVKYSLKRFLDDAEKIESQLSKWLTYIVLLIAATTIIGDLITSIYFLLQGEITARFFLKALTILVVAGGVFGFYFFERKVVQFRQSVRPCLFRAFALGASLLVLSGIILGFLVGGSPATERLRGLDQQRAEDLSRIASCVSSYAAAHKRLPESLVDLERSADYGYCPGNTFDPERAVPYEYAVIEASTTEGAVVEGTFELCAEFSLSSLEDKTLPAHSYDSGLTKWTTHTNGRACDMETVVLDNPLNVITEKGLLNAEPAR